VSTRPTVGRECSSYVLRNGTLGVPMVTLVVTLAKVLSGGQCFQSASHSCWHAAVAKLVARS
jgi:hypothetical protein